MQLDAELIMRLDVNISPPLKVGKTGQGDLAIIPIIGGAFSGPDIKGDVCPGGADWNTRIDDSTAHVFAKYWLSTDDGETISVQNEGIINVNNKDSVIVTTPKFSTNPKGKYGFLSYGVFVGELSPGKDADWVKVTIYKMR